MGNVFRNLPVPAGNGVGPAVDVTTMGAPKAMVVTNHANCLVEVQTSNDGVHWDGLATFSAASQGVQSVPRACAFLRAKVDQLTSGVPQVDVGSTDDGTTISVLDVPPSGAGAPFDTSALPLYKTIQAAGSFSGKVSVEISEDGITAWSQVATFLRPGEVTIEMPASFMRVKRGDSSAGLPLISVASTNPPGGASGNPDVPTPPFAVTTRIIYARTTGSDLTGDGKTIPTAYATFQRAVRDVPQDVPPGATYYVDMTGINENLPDDYTLPAWSAPGPRNGTIPQYARYFFSQAPINIVAVPEPTPGLGADGIINFGDVVISQDPITDLTRYTFTIPRPSLAGVKGKRVVVAPTSPNGVSNGVIYEVDPGGAFITIATNSAFGPVPTDFPLTIMDLTGTLHGSGFEAGTLNVFNVDCIGIKGLDIHSDVGNYGLYAEGLGTTIIELCDLAGPHVCSVADSVVYATSFNRFLSCWITGGFIELSNSFLFVQSFGEGLNSGDFSNHNVLLFAPCNPTITSAVFIDCDPIESVSYGPGTGELFPAAMGQAHIQDVLLKGGTADGIIFHGNAGFCGGVDFAGNAGNGVTLLRGAGVLRLENCGSSTPNGGFGVAITDGMQVSADVATTTAQPAAGRPLAGGAGQVSVGSVGSTPWATVAGTLNVPDYAGPAATGARISQQ